MDIIPAKELKDLNSIYKLREETLKQKEMARGRKETTSLGWLSSLVQLNKERPWLGKRKKRKKKSM